MLPGCCLLEWQADCLLEQRHARWYSRISSEIRSRGGSVAISYHWKQQKKEQIISDQICTQANKPTAFFLNTARYRHWWSHWCSLWDHQTYQHIYSWGYSKKVQWSCHTHQGLNCNWLKVVIALEVMVFLAFCSLSLCCRKTCLPVWQCLSGPKQKSPQLLHPILY